MNRQKIRFDNRDGLEIVARLESPPEGVEHYGYGIFAHCFTGNKNLNAVRNISKTLVANGFSILQLDFTGLGESEGQFSDSNFSSNINDLKDAAAYLEKNYEAPKLMVGHSLGGAATIFAANQIDSIKAYATIGAPADPVHVTHLLEDELDVIIRNGQAKCTIGGRTFIVKKQFLDDLQEQDVSEVLNFSNKPYIIFHSPQDEVVGLENASDLYKLARHPKSFIALSGANHMLTNTEDSNYVGEVIAAWAMRYL